MGFASRKLRMFFILMAMLCAAYLFYTRLSQTPRISLTSTDSDRSLADQENAVGMLDDTVGVGTVKIATFRDADREFGFEKLLHEEGNEWEIEKPYMNIFRRDLNCYITADMGKVQVETGVGIKVNPKEATLTGNVVFHIVPQRPSDVKESFIYLDNVDFISEKSEFSTSGPVKFVSQDVHLSGRGLELIYNDELDRLEFFKIADLDSLHIKVPRADWLSLEQKGEVPPRANETVGEKQHQPESTRDSNTQQAPKKLPADKQNINQYYTCVFSKNVVIKSAEQLVFTDLFSIYNIFFSKKANEQSEQTDSNTADSNAISGNNTKKNLNFDANNPDISPSDSSPSLALTVSEPNQSDSESFDVVITCDDGIVVVPANSAQSIRDLSDIGNKSASIPSRTIDRFDKLDELKRYTLAAPKVTVNLSKDNRSPSKIEQITANGGLVQLASVKKSKEGLLGFTKLKCMSLGYIPDQRLFWAKGPNGVMAVDNSKVAQPDKNMAGFGLRTKCYAVLQGFETLKYFLLSNQIIADARTQQINIVYVPIAETSQVQPVNASAKHIEVKLAENPDGRNDLVSLAATNGVSYKADNIEFEGSSFLYDADKSLITVWGDESHRAYVNGTFVDVIEYDLKNGTLKTKILGPSSLQLK